MTVAPVSHREDSHTLARFTYKKMWMMNFRTCGGDFQWLSNACWRNYAAGYIDWDATFPSGVKFPPAWAGCECGIMTLEIEVPDPELPLKSWVTMGDSRVCQVCITNENVGWIAQDRPFPSGHDKPPAHDHCRCRLARSTRPRTPPVVDDEPKPDPNIRSSSIDQTVRL